MKKTIFFFILSLSVCSFCTAQSVFQYTIGGTADDYAQSIIPTFDGWYVAAGETRSYGAGARDFYIVKFNGNGIIQWSKSVGSSGDMETGYSVAQTLDSGYVIVGYTPYFGAGDYDAYIVKFSNSGTYLWSKTIGGTNFDIASCVIRTTDGGFAVAGSTSSFGAGLGDVWILKFDAGGTFQWNKTIGGTNRDDGYSIVQTSDGGYAVAGYTLSFGAGSANMFIVKLDAGGTIQWSRTVGGTSSDAALSITQSTDGGYVAAGTTTSFGAGNSDDYVVKLNSSGVLQWTRTVGGTQQEGGYVSITRTSDGGYAVTSQTLSFGAGANDLYVFKLDGSGTLLWSRACGGSNDDYGNSIIQSSDGGLIVGGDTRSFGTGATDMYIVKFNSGGITCGNYFSPPSVSGTGGTTTSPTPTVTSPIPTITSPTSITSTGGTLTTLCFVGIQPNSNQIPSSYMLYQNYPNPFNPTTKIKFSLPPSPSKMERGQGGEVVRLILYDILGREVATLVNEQLKPGSYEVEWYGSDYPSGVYFYKIITESFSNTKRMVLVK